jgi:hypothetical protein
MTMQKTTKRYELPIFSNIKSYSVEEILAAGGTSAFAAKMGKSPEKLLETLQNIPQPFFSDEEWDSLVEQIKNDR